MSDIDKTKKNIGIPDMDEKTRKKMFKQFVDAGGEVPSDRQKRRNLSIDREKQRDYLKKIDSQKQKNNQRIKRQPTKPTLKNKSQQNKQSSFSKIVDRLKLKILLKFHQVAQFNALYFNFKFLKKFNNIYRPAITEIQLDYFHLFKSNPSVAKRIIPRLNKTKKIYYELIEMTADLFEKTYMDQIVEQYLNFPDIPKRLKDLKEPLLTLYRKIYLLKSFENTILNGFWKAMDLEYKLKENEISSHVLNQNKRKVKNNLFIIFHKLFPKLHLLFCFYNNTCLSIENVEIEKFLSISEDEKPGNKIFQQNYSNQEETNISDKTSKQDQKGKKDNSLDQATTEGLSLMYNIKLQELKQKFDKKQQFKHVNPNDTVFITFLLFLEFDHEYSTILTTNKIKYNVTFEKNGKIDFKIILADLYNKMRECLVNLHNYSEAIVTYQKKRQDKPANQNQHYVYVKELESLKKEINLISKTAKNSIKEFMDEVVKNLEVLTKDMEGEQHYVQNPQDVLEYKIEIEGNEKLNNKKVYEAVNIVHNFAKAFSYRLSTEGDLFPPLLHSKEKSEEDNLENFSEKNEDNDNKSILEDLEDLV